MGGSGSFVSMSMQLSSAICCDLLQVVNFNRSVIHLRTSLIGIAHGKLVICLHTFYRHRFWMERACHQFGVQYLMFVPVTEFNLEKIGVTFEVIDAAGGRTEYCLHAKYEATCADEKALKEIASTKGAGGFKCCQQCTNCYNGDPAASGDIVHYRDLDMKKFRRATPEMYHEMADRLTDLVATGCSKVEFAAYEQMFGLKYNPRGVLWDKRIREIARMPETQVYDSQHSLFSSGEVFQYQVNGFICKLLEISEVKLPDLDKFTTQLRPPRNPGKVPSRFFEERVRTPSTDNRAPHIKAFANETLMALEILWFFRHLYCGTTMRWQSMSDVSIWR